MNIIHHFDESINSIALKSSYSNFSGFKYSRSECGVIAPENGKFGQDQKDKPRY